MRRFLSQRLPSARTFAVAIAGNTLLADGRHHTGTGIICADGTRPAAALFTRTVAGSIRADTLVADGIGQAVVDGDDTPTSDLVTALCARAAFLLFLFGTRFRTIACRAIHIVAALTALGG